MTSTVKKTVHIRPYSKRNGITLTFVGGVLVVIGIALFLVSATYFVQGLVSFCIGILALVLGVAKMFEPEASLSLHHDRLIFRHRKGQISLPWSVVQRIDTVRVHHGMEQIDLPFIGIKLKDITPMLDSISPRLATGLLTEQRPLMMTAAAQDESLDTLEAYLGAEFTPLNLGEKNYSGVLAMFGHRSQMLNKYLGYHFYIANDSLDRPASNAITLLRNYCQEGREI